MGKKRKQDQRRDESSSSDAKRHRSCHCQNGYSSDGMPREGLPNAFRDAVIELKDFIQVKVNMEEKFKRKIKKLKQKRKEDKNKHKEYIRILMEDVRMLKESHEELKSKFQETQKEGCAEVNHYDASPSQRSQLSQSIRFRLVIENEVRKTIYKRERVETVDGGGRIKIVMYDGVNQIASDHPLASLRVDLVVIEGWFNECKPTQDNWSKEEFEKSIVQPRRGITRVVKNGTFDLVDGSGSHEGAIIMDNSQQREVKLGVMVAVHTEVRILEGVSNPFKVQEARTKNSGSKKKVQKPSSLVPTRNLAQPTSIHETQHGQGLVSQGEQHSLPPPVFQGLLQKEDRGKHKQFPTGDTAEDNRLRSCPPATMPLIAAPVEGNGQALYNNGQKSSQQIPMQILGQSSSSHSMQHGQDCSLPPSIIQRPLQAAENNRLMSCPPATMPLIAAPVEGNGQSLYGNSQKSSQQIPMQFLGQSSSTHSVQHGQDCSLPPPNIQRPLQAAGNFPAYQIPLDCGQGWYTGFPNASSELDTNISAYALLNDLQTGQWTSTREGEISVEDVLNAQEQIQGTYGSFRCGQVLLLWDKPDVQLKQRRNFLDQLMPLYITNSRFCSESFPSTSLMDKAHKLLSSVTRTPHRRGVLIRPIDPYYSDDEPPVKKQRHAEYQLRFVNRVCSDYYTREQIKSDNGNLLKVALYDENNLVVTSGPLSSASVEVVLLHGDFNAEGQDNWTSEEFSTCLVYPQSVKEPPALGGDRVLVLIDGEADLGNINFQNSSFHARTGKFKMGVEIKNVREERIQEGITSPFLVRVRQGEGGFSKKSNVGFGGYGGVYKVINNTMENKLQDTSVTSMELPYKLLKEITNDFSQDHRIGSGTHGVVYKGVLKTGVPIAVKKLDKNLRLDINKQFLNECTRLIKLRHENVVQFLGYSYFTDKVISVPKEKALCFEFLSGGNIDKHLLDEFSGCGWGMRYNIIKGICEGLNYLHSNKIYHLNLKPSNILLDMNMVPKISDFGISRLIDSTGSTGEILTTPLAYMPPEYVKEQIISTKFDIYSLGVLIVQIITGHAYMSSQESIKNVTENWIKKRETAMRPYALEQMQKCIKVALKCAEANRVKRPTTIEIVDELNKIDTASSSCGSSYIPTLEKQDELCGQQHSKMKTQSVSGSEEELAKEELVSKEESYLKPGQEVYLNPGHG